MIRLRNPEFVATLSQNQVSTEWSQRVVANGGPLPSQSTITAMETFRLALISSGLSSKMHSVCVFVPDSLIAATTPLIVGIGIDPWTNNNFTGADLTVEGLMGGGTRYLDSGVRAKSGFAFNSITGNAGMTCVITETDGNAAGTNMGYQDGTTHQFLLFAAGIFSTSGQTYFTTNGPSGGFNLTFTDWNRCGYVSGNSVSGTLSVYEASPLRAHALAGSAAVASSPTTTNNTIYVFAANNTGVAGGNRAERMSFAAIHDGLTISESATFAGLIQTLRTSLGGGTGDEIVNWANRSVTLGGTTISDNTKTALRTFYSGLVSNSLLADMVAVNCIVPDSLTAARQPLIWNAGNELWTNNNFTTADLTVNGLTGDGAAKYLTTGINNSTAQILTDNSGGISVMCYSSGGGQIMGGTTGSGSTHFTLALPTNTGGADTISFYCWGFSGASGANYLTIAGGYAAGLYPGFISGNRTASNAIAAYAASYSTPFATLATGTGAKTQNRFNLAMLAMAGAQPAAGGFQLGTASFLSVHGGLSSTKASALFDLVLAMRISLGGGYDPTVYAPSTDDLESYSDGASLDGLNGGSNWSDAYASR